MSIDKDRHGTDELRSAALRSSSVREQEQFAGTKQPEAKKPPGLYSLMYAISELRDTAMFRDEEGGITNNLRALRHWADRRELPPSGGLPR